MHGTKRLCGILTAIAGTSLVFCLFFFTTMLQAADLHRETDHPGGLLRFLVFILSLVFFSNLVNLECLCLESFTCQIINFFFLFLILASFTGLMFTFGLYNLKEDSLLKVSKKVRAIDTLPPHPRESLLTASLD